MRELLKEEFRHQQYIVTLVLERRQVELQAIQAIEQISAELAIADRFAEIERVATMTRVVTGSVQAANSLDRAFLQESEQTAWASSGRLPIASRNMVPPAAISIRPIFRKLLAVTLFS